MSKKLRKIPLLDVAEHSDRIRLLDLDLPKSVDPEKLDLNLHRLNKIIDWGNIGYLAIGSYDGETTSYVPTGFGVSLDGTMTGTGMKIAQKAKTIAPESEMLGEGERYIFKHRNTALYFNSPEIADRTENSGKDAVKLIDGGLRQGLWSDIYNNELSARKALGEMAIASAYLLPFCLVGNLGGLHDGVAKTMVSLVLPKIWLPVVDKISGGTKKMTAHRNDRFERLGEVGQNLKPSYSTMFRWRFDRATMAGAYLTHKLITERQE